VRAHALHPAISREISLKPFDNSGLHHANGAFDLDEERLHIIRTDPHGHYLPGLDDGSKDLEMSIAMGRLAAANGFRNVVATPHACHPASTCHFSPDDLRRMVASLNDAYRDNGIDVTVYPGMELLIDEVMIGLHEDGQLMTWADQGRYILLELGFHELRPGAWNVLEYFEGKGLTPIIAHPERYTWLSRDRGTLERLIERNCIFQINVMSVNGRWGADIQRFALDLLRTVPRWIVGTDAHSDAPRFWEIKGVRAKLQEERIWESPLGGEALQPDYARNSAAGT
jgi:protein-tyrosine phosphatase